MFNDFLIEWRNASPQVRLQTSGSTGTPKVFFADKERLRASARMTCDFLGLREGGTALLCLSCDYIAGKMMVVRAEERGLRLVEVAPSNRPLEALEREHPDIGVIDLCAMVPSQVYCSINHPLLPRIRHLIVGGGPVPSALETRLRALPTAVWSSYGMTETLSHIALRRVSGAEADEWYRPLPGVCLSLSEEGCLVIDAPVLSPERLVTNDLAELLPDGRFRILGRRDNVILSGGLKLHIEEEEERLRPLLPDCEGRPVFCISCRPHDKLGEEAVLLVERPWLEAASEALHHPYIKSIIPADVIPVTPTGKIDRAAARRLAEA